MSALTLLKCLNLSVMLELAALPLLADGISGRVFRDENSNGRFDKGERLLRGVGISDGDTIVWSDRRGFYSLPARRKFLPVRGLVSVSRS